MAYTQFVLKVDLGNAAFDEPHPELQRILNQVHERLDRLDVEGFIYDINGNKVGAWSIDDDIHPTTSSIQKYL